MCTARIIYTKRGLRWNRSTTTNLISNELVWKELAQILISTCITFIFIFADSVFMCVHVREYLSDSVFACEK